MSEYTQEAAFLIAARPGLCGEILRQMQDRRKVGGMTKRQRDLILFIRRYIGEHGISPSYDEMKDALGLASKSGIFRMMKALEERGFIDTKYDRARSVTLRVRV